jgi:hypothetical protein
MDGEGLLDVYVSLWEKNDKICKYFRYGARLLMRLWNAQRAKETTRNGNSNIFQVSFAVMFILRKFLMLISEQNGFGESFSLPKFFLVQWNLAWI